MFRRVYDACMCVRVVGCPQVDKAEIMPGLAKDMLATLQKLNESTFSPYRGPGEQNRDIDAACTAAVDKYGGFFGPFVDV